jgi:hypothetical protein
MSTVIVIPQRALESAVTKLLEEERQPPQETPIETSKKRKAAEPAEENEDEVVERAAGLTEANARNNHDTAPVIEQAVVPTQPDNAVAATAAAAAARPRARQGSVACVIEGCFGDVGVGGSGCGGTCAMRTTAGDYRCPHYDQCGRDYSNIVGASSQHMFVTHGATRIQCPGGQLRSHFSLARHARAPRRPLPSRAGARHLPRHAPHAQRRGRAARARRRHRRRRADHLRDVCQRRSCSSASISPRSTASRGPTATSIAAELERIDKQAPPYEFPLPVAQLHARRASTATELRQHYIALHRTALGDDLVRVQGRHAGRPARRHHVGLGAANVVHNRHWTERRARRAAAGVARSTRAHDTVGVSRRPHPTGRQPAGVPTATAAADRGDAARRQRAALPRGARGRTGQHSTAALRLGVCSAARAWKIQSRFRRICGRSRLRSAFTPFAQPASGAAPPAAEHRCDRRLQVNRVCDCVNVYRLSMCFEDAYFLPF